MIQESRGREVTMDKEEMKYILQLPFESTFEYESTRQWIQDNTLNLLSSILIYLSMIALGRLIMSSKQPFNLKLPLLLWNVSLSLFSLFGCLRVTQEFVATYKHQGGLYATICYANKSNGPYALWSYLFTMSKVIELIDTIFIVLRKSPLIFLHWYHHAVTLAFGVIASSRDLSLGRWIMLMNFSIHFLMYGYYALKQLGIQVSKKLAMIITTMQLTQMAIGVSVFTYAYWVNNSSSSLRSSSSSSSSSSSFPVTQLPSSSDTLAVKLPCETSQETIIAGLLMYFSYLILFVNFFIQTYLKNKVKKTGKGEVVSPVTQKSVTMSSDVNDNVAMSKKVH